MQPALDAPVFFHVRLIVRFASNRAEAAMRRLILSLSLSALWLAACAPPATQVPTPLEPTFSPLPPDPLASPTLLPAEQPPGSAQLEFKTDFNKHTVPYQEILSGGPPRDGIPSIDSPRFISVNEADTWLEPMEPVIFVQVDEDARAYPIQILMWHEIVNDTVGDLPLTVTFCPLCNTAIAFERTVSGRVLDFGTTGRLRYSNLIMYDRQTETWWQQASGDAIAGELTGTQLEFYPAAIIAWEEFKTAHADGKVLSRQTGFSRDYGRNPYVGYDNVNNSPFLYQGPPTPNELPPTARVLTIDLHGDAVAYTYDLLSEVRLINDTVGDEPVVVFWQAGTASPLDSVNIPAGRDIGTAIAFSPKLEDQVLTFSLENDLIKDQETGSSWNVLGLATDGPLKGTQLSPVVSINHFWFSWAAFRPQTRIYQP